MLFLMYCAMFRFGVTIINDVTSLFEIDYPDYSDKVKSQSTAPKQLVIPPGYFS